MDLIFALIFLFDVAGSTLFSLILFGGIIYLIFAFRGLSKRVKNLEFNKNFTPQKPRVAASSVAKTSPPPAVAPAKPSNVFSPANFQTAPAKIQPKKEKKESKSGGFETFLGQKFFAIFGAVSVALAIGFFVSWAFSNGLVGPKGRIAIGVLASLFLLAGGEIMRNRFPNFWEKVSAAGIAGLLITIYLGRNFEFQGLAEPILSAGQTFLFSAVSVAAAAAIAVKNRARMLANLSILGGLAAPVLSSTPDPNPVGLLAYLLILAAAGFGISVVRKWPEMIGVLFLGTTLFSYLAFDFMPEKIAPIVFLAFVFATQFLLASGGIVRSVLEKTSPKIDHLSVKSVFEILIFLAAVFAANAFGFAVFENQNWDHFGLLVLAQGFALFGLKNFCATKNLSVFEHLLTAGVLGTIVFATVWEIGAENEFALSLFLTAESVLLALGAKKLAAQKSLSLGFSSEILRVFARGILVLPFFFIFEISDFLQSSIAVLAFLGATIFSMGLETKSALSKIFLVLSALASVWHVLNWSFEKLSTILPPDFQFLVFLFPVILGVASAFSVLKYDHRWARFAAIALLGIIDLIAINWFEDTWRDLKRSFHPQLIAALVIILAGNFGVLASFFLAGKNLETPRNQKIAATIAVLGATTLLVLIFGNQFLDEPARSIFWMIWAGALLGFGFGNDWPHFRYFGIGVFLFLIAKLYLIDIWNFEVWVRFVAFLVFGICLLGVSFLYSKNKK